jgi:serine/threonine protein kinase/tetratricopeptide (TPR) repeat protein
MRLALPDAVEREAARETDAASLDASARVGQSIGSYRLERVLGEGGMGVVYLAVQEQPIRRQVALKLIKLGMDSYEVLDRFEIERRALELMDHPGVARVLDAGATAEGQPYFVMEYVPGLPITTYCDENRLGFDDRIELFMAVCEAVQHAHLKGIIHRDLKPSNVLVTEQDGRPVPKVIDFGLAKATEQRLLERSAFTRLGQLIGTPEYMSPEQARVTGEDVDTRTDLYSLGILLYEILAGVPPFDREDLRRVGLEGVLRHIREDASPRPSVRVSSLGDAGVRIATNRRTNLPSLGRLLQGDLDWIVMKAIEKEPARRYATVQQLAADLGRYLRDEPVEAGPPSAGYRIGKFVRRHRLGVVATGSGVLALLLGATVATVGWVRAIRAEASAVAAQSQALEEAETSEQVSEFLAGLFRESDPLRTKGDELTARELLDRGAARIAEELDDQPEVQARMMVLIGNIYFQMGLYEQARPLLESSLRIRRDVLADDEPDLALSLVSMARLLDRTADPAGATPLLEEALEIQERALGPDAVALANTTNILALANKHQGHFERAKELHLQSVGILERSLGPDDVQVGSILNNLGLLHRQLGEYDQARECLERALEIYTAEYGTEHFWVASTSTNLAEVYRIQGEPEKAKALFQSGIETLEKIVGPDYEGLAAALNSLANLHYSLHEDDEAAALYQRAIEIYETSLGPDHPYNAYPTHNLANLHRVHGDYAKAARLYARALELHEKGQGRGPPRRGQRSPGLQPVTPSHRGVRHSRNEVAASLENPPRETARRSSEYLHLHSPVGRSAARPGAIRGSRSLAEQALRGPGSRSRHRR